MSDTQYEGRLEDLQAWQAVHQMIGYLSASLPFYPSDEWRLSVLRGLEQAVGVLNRPVVAEDVALYTDLDGPESHFRIEVTGAGRIRIRATDISDQDNRVLDVDLREAAGRLMRLM